MPSTVAPGFVVDAGASGGPASSGIASGPSGWVAGWEVEVVPGVLAVPVLVLDALELVLVLLLLELPHAARTQAASSEITVQTRRADIAAANGSGRRAVVSCGSMSSSGPITDMPMTTGLEVPGLRIRENLGVCYGLVVRSMGMIGGMTASFKALRRGEISEYTQLLEDSRRHAIERMVDNARLLGADAIVAVRFDSSEIGQQFTEIVAYGTAVKADRAAA
jgi:uncharacterized protein YbjQ (UPF0145 family)